MRILGISGSLRRGSHNRKLLQAAADALPPGASLEAWEGIAALPAYDEDLDDVPAPPAVERLRRAIEHADALLIATPEYNAGVPGGLKNAIDWASRPFPDNALRGKPALVIGASTGLFGAVWAQADVRKSLKFAGAHVLENEVPVGLADDAFDEDGSLKAPELRDLLQDAVTTLVREVDAPVEQAA